MNQIKTFKLILFFILIAQITHIFTPAVSAEEVIVGARNEETQADSTNTADARVTRWVVILNSNSAELQNIINQEANTGGNTISEVNGNVQEQTGDIQQEVNVETSVNYNQTTVEGVTGGEIEAVNEQTGADSYNEATSELTEVIEITNMNEAEIVNDVTTTLNTGFNAVEEVNGDVEIETGNIEFVVDLANDPINTNQVTVNSTQENIQISANNQQTQAHSFNSASAGVFIEINEFDYNHLQIQNKVDLAVNTGFNHCGGINGGCVIKTGNIYGKIGVENRGNENEKQIGPRPEPEGPVQPTPTPTESPIPTPTPSITPDVDKETSDVDVFPPEVPKGGTLPEEEQPVLPGEEITEEEIEELRAEEQPEEISFLEELIAKIISPVQAQEAEEKEVLGAMELPTTGIGEIPYVSWQEVGIALLLLILGLLLRQRFKKEQPVSIQE